MELAIAMCLGCLAPLIRIENGRARVITGVVLSLAVALQIREYRLYARKLIQPAVLEGRSETKIARWFALHGERHRVMVPGSVSFWLNALTTTPQSNGCCSQNEIFSAPRIAKYMLGTDDGAGSRAAEISILWLKTLGVKYVALCGAKSTEPFQEIRHPRKFDGLLPERWHEGDDAIFELPGRASASLAHWIPRSAVIGRIPINGVDVTPLEPYVRSLEAADQPDARFAWQSTGTAVIEGKASPGNFLSVQIPFHAGWRASDSKGQNVPVRHDALGMILLEPDCRADCRVIMTFDGGGEQRALHVIQILSWLTVFATLIWARRPRKSFPVLTLVAVSAWTAMGAQSVQATFEQAVAALQAKHYAEAESGFRIVLKAEPRNVGALGNLGVVYSQTSRYTQAIETYRTALRAAPGDFSLLTNLGLAYVKQEQFAPAAAILEDLVTRQPDNTQVRELLASCRISLRQYDSALATLAPLMASAKSGTYYLEGIALAGLKRTDAAHQAFTRMMNQANPAEADFLMGKASYETGDFEQALSFFTHALAENSELAAAHRELGKTLISLRRNDEAERELRLADPNDAEVPYFLGALLSRTKPEEAVRYLRRASELTPDFWGPLYYQGRLELEQGRTQQAIPLLKRAAELKPQESAIQYQLAKAYQANGRPQEAKAAFARVKDLKERSLRKEVDVLTPTP